MMKQPGRSRQENFRTEGEDRRHDNRRQWHHTTWDRNKTWYRSKATSSNLVDIKEWSNHQSSPCGSVFLCQFGPSNVNILNLDPNILVKSRLTFLPLPTCRGVKLLIYWLYVLNNWVMRKVTHKHVVLFILPLNFLVCDLYFITVFENKPNVEN